MFAPSLAAFQVNETRWTPRLRVHNGQLFRAEPVAVGHDQQVPQSHRRVDNSQPSSMTENVSAGGKHIGDGAQEFVPCHGSLCMEVDSPGFETAIGGVAHDEIVTAWGEPLG